MNRHVPWLLIAASVAAVIYAMVLEAYQTPEPAALTAPATGFSGTRAVRVLQRLLANVGPHPMETQANAQVRSRIVDELQALGLHVEQHSGAMACGPMGSCGVPTNLIVRLPGVDTHSDDQSASAGTAILLAAHYDSVPAGPGASDDGASVAAVIEIVRALLHRPRPLHPIVVLLDDGEERGLLGAQAFVQGDPWARSIAAAVNVDARGTSGPSLMFETGTANRWLMELYARATRRPLTNSVYYAIYKTLPNATDFTVFKANGYQGFNFAFIQAEARYHTPLDDLAHIDAGSIQSQGDAALAVLWALANVSFDDPSLLASLHSEAVYSDAFGRVLLRAPQTWVLPVTVLAILLVAVAIARCIVRGEVAWRIVAWDFASDWLALLLSALSSGLVLWLLSVGSVLKRLGDTSFSAEAWPLELSFVALGLAATLAVLKVTQARSSPIARWSALVCVDLLIALIAALTLPGASYVPLAPALAGTLLLCTLTLIGPVALRRSTPSDSASISANEALLPLSAILAFAVRLLSAVPLAVPLYAALGSLSLPMLSVLASYVALGIAPLWARESPRLQAVVVGVLSGVVVVGLLLAIRLPQFTRDLPQKISFIYAEDGDARSVRWLVVPESAQLPAALGIPTDERPQRAWEWSDLRVFVRQGPSVALEAPEMTLIHGARKAGRSHYTIKVRSLRGATRLSLLFAPNCRVGGVSIGSSPAAAQKVEPSPSGEGWRWLDLFGTYPDGLVINFEAAQGPVDLVLADESTGLPQGGVELERARGLEAVPSDSSDRTIVTHSLQLNAQ